MGEAEFGDWPTADQVFLDDAFEVFGCAAVVPGAFRVHDADGTLATHSQAFDLRAVDAALHIHQLQFAQSPLEKFPRCVLFSAWRAIAADA